MKIRRSTLIPSILLVYLAVMSYLGYPDFVSGRNSKLEYIGGIIFTLIVIVLLHFSLRRRERLRREREEDMRNSQSRNK